MRVAIEPIDASKEPKLQAIIESFSRVVDKAQYIATLEVVGINTLFKVNRKAITQKLTILFSSTISKNTLKKYYRF